MQKWDKKFILFLWVMLSMRKDFGLVAESGPLPEFEAVLGSTARIPCLVPQRPPESGIKCIFWYKDDEVMSVYTIDAREGSNSLHVPSDKLQTRASFDPSPWPPILKIVAVNEDDAGVYYCRVDYRWDRTYMYNTVLKIIVPPSKLAILNEHDEDIVGIAGPYLEGQAVKLICEAIGGKPLPHLSWWRGKTPLKAGKQVTFHEVVRSEYSFLPRRSDVLSSITCRSTNNNITIPKTVSVQIDLYLKPIDIRTSPNGISFSAGRRTEVRCFSGGSRPPARISWFLDNEPLSNHTDLLSMDRNQTSSILTFWPSRSDDKKYLRCKAENFLLQGSALQEGWTLNVTYVPMVTMTMKGSSKRSTAYLEGDDVRFTCDAKANPPVTEVGWLFNSRSLNPDPEIVVGYRSLLVRRVKRSHRGQYQCYAKNFEGTGFSRVMILRAMYAPVCRGGLKTTYAVPVGEMARVECQVEADPPKVDFKWSFSNSVNRHYNVSYTSGGLRSVASYKPEDARDFGTLYCWGANSAGEQQKPCIFTVIPVGPPETLRNCSAINVTMSSVTVVCVMGSKKDPDLKYNLEMFMYDSHVPTFMTSRPTPIFYVPDLPPGTDLLFAVYAVNVNGKSSPVLVRAKTLRTPVEERVFHEKEEEADYPWFGLSMLIFGAIGCLLIVGSAAVWRRFHGTASIEKCKELPKQFRFKKRFTKGIKADKNYIDRTPEIWDRAPCM